MRVKKNHLGLLLDLYYSNDNGGVILLLIIAGTHHIFIMSQHSPNVFGKVFFTFP